MGELRPDPLGADHHTILWQRTGAVGEGDPVNPDEICRGVLQQTGSPWLLDLCDEETGRKKQSSPSLTFNDVYPQQCMAINSNICLHFFHFRPDDDWSIQLKCRAWRISTSASSLKILKYQLIHTYGAIFIDKAQHYNS